MWGVLWAAALGACVAASGQQYDSLKAFTSDEILLGRIRYVAAQTLSRLPNFTCVETIERSRRAAPTKRYEFLDTVRLEVAYLEGKEMYSWPGDSRFEDRDLPKMVGGQGAIGTGDFVLHAKAVLLGTEARLEPPVREVREGRPVYRINYRVPMLESRYTLRILPEEGVVGYSGALWHDQESLDLVKIETVIDEIPPNLPLKWGEKVIRYKRIPIGGELQLMPVSMEMTLTHASGQESRNVASFSNCRQYSGESTLTFEEPAETKAAVSKVAVTLPEGLTVMLRPSRPVDLKTAARGDLFEAEVLRDVKRRDVVLLPKGAAVKLRISKLLCLDSPVAHCWLAVRPERFEFGNKEGEFRAAADPLDLDRLTMMMRNVPRPILIRERITVGDLEPGAGLFLLRGNKSLPSDYQMLWRTLND
jgi:hypothetical protein